MEWRLWPDNMGSFLLELRGFGALSLLLGVGIPGWLAYNGYVRRLSEFTGLTAIAHAVLPIALIGFGYRLLTPPMPAVNTDHDAAMTGSWRVTPQF